MYKRQDTDSRAVFLTFTDEFFQKEEQEGIQQIDGSFSFYAGADREKLKEDPDPVLIVGNQQIPLHAEKDSDARPVSYTHLDVYKIQR